MTPWLGLVPVIFLGAAAWQAGDSWGHWRKRKRAQARALAAASQTGNPGRSASRAWLDLRRSLERTLERSFPAASFRLQVRLQAHPEVAASAGALFLQGAVLALLGIVLLWSLDTGLYAIFGLGLGLLPGIKLSDAEKERTRLLRQALPDAVDLLSACVQAGLGLDQSLERCGSQLPAGPLRQEWQAALESLRSGASRADAFAEWARRCPGSDVEPVLKALLRSEKRGVPLSPVLRSTAAQMRRLRSLRIQAEAARAPVKMLLPLMLFFLPAVFLLLFGPILLKFSELGF